MTEIVVQKEMLECSICMEQLDENCKMLPCQHTYCKTCLETMYKHEGSLNCPQCRKMVPNENGCNPIDTLPTNLILLSLIEEVNRNPPKLRNENDELQVAITNSIEEFQKEKTKNMLLKHNDHLQTQLALENSKRDVLPKNTQDMSEKLNKQFLSQKSYDQEIFKRENQNLLSEQENLEVEVAILKSEQTHPDNITDLISWFETNHVELNQDLKKEVQIVLTNFKRAKITQQNDSIQRRLRNILESLEGNQRLETPTKLDEIHKDVVPRSQKDNIIDAVNNKLEEVKFLLKNESSSDQMNPKTVNCYSKSLGHTKKQPPFLAHQHSFQNYYMSPRFMCIPPNPRGFMPNYYHQPYYGPSHYSHYPPHFPSGSNFMPGLHHPPDPRSYLEKNADANRNSFGNKSNRTGLHSTSASNFTHLKVEKEKKFSKSLILPDMRDYDQFGEKMRALNFQKNRNRKQKCDEKKSNKVYEWPTSRRKVGEPTLMLPDVRDYDHMYSKFAHSRRSSAFGDGQNDTKSFGTEHRGEMKKSSNLIFFNFNREKPHHRRDKNRYRSGSRSNLNQDEFESDSSNDSKASVSSNLSTCSTPILLHEKKRDFSHKRRNSHRKFYDIEMSEERSKKKIDQLTKLIYPSRKEAQEQHLDVEKPFKTPLVCLGKNKEDPVSDIVQCLADIYTFEEKYSECKLVRY